VEDYRFLRGYERLKAVKGWKGDHADQVYAGFLAERRWRLIGNLSPELRGWADPLHLLWKQDEAARPQLLPPEAAAETGAPGPDPGLGSGRPEAGPAEGLDAHFPPAPSVASRESPPAAARPSDLGGASAWASDISGASASASDISGASPADSGLPPVSETDPPSDSASGAAPSPPGKGVRGLFRRIAGLLTGKAYARVAARTVPDQRNVRGLEDAPGHPAAADGPSAQTALATPFPAVPPALATPVPALPILAAFPFLPIADVPPTMPVVEEQEEGDGPLHRLIMEAILARDPTRPSGAMPPGEAAVGPGFKKAGQTADGNGAGRFRGPAKGSSVPRESVGSMDSADPRVSLAPAVPKHSEGFRGGGDGGMQP
jgi:hypothetical protein